MQQRLKSMVDAHEKVAAGKEEAAFRRTDMQRARAIDKFSPWERVRFKPDAVVGEKRRWEVGLAVA